MEWFENEDFWKSFYPHMFNEQRFTAAAGEADRVLALTGVTSGSVLDLCCGPGRHSVALADKGFRVTAVDRSPFLLGKARERAGNLPVEIVEADMRTFVREETYDLVVSLFTSFGYFETRAEDLSVLKNIKASLKPGGTFLIDVISKEYVASQPCHTFWQTLENGEIYVQNAEILPGWSRVHVTWILIRGDRAVRHDFYHNLYSGQEFVAMLEGAGFTDIHIFGSLDGTPYDATVKRLVARAKV